MQSEIGLRTHLSPTFQPTSTLSCPGGLNVARTHPGAEKTFVNLASLGDKGVLDEADKLVDLGRECHHVELAIHCNVAHSVNARANFLHALL